MQQTQTASQALATVLLGEDVHDWIRSLRSARPQWTYQLIADELATRTDGQVALTGEAIRRWAAES